MVVSPKVTPNSAVLAAGAPEVLGNITGSQVLPEPEATVFQITNTIAPLLAKLKRTLVPVVSATKGAAAQKVELSATGEGVPALAAPESVPAEVRVVAIFNSF
jgi:hypothetical protein